jgi:hypothetical protein
LHFKRAFVDATIHYAVEARTALIVQRRRSEVRVTCINGRATRQEFMGKGWAAVIPKRAKHWVGIDLIARAS